MKASAVVPVSRSTFGEFNLVGVEANPYYRLAQALHLTSDDDYSSALIDDHRSRLEAIASNRSATDLAPVARFLLWRVEVNVRRRGYTGNAVPIHGMDLMTACRALFAYAIPSSEAIERIVRHVKAPLESSRSSALASSLIEVGAGTGYWSALLSHAGLAVRAYDNRQWKIVPLWYDVRCAPAKIAADSTPADTLLLCWPPYRTRMAEIALRSFKGRTLVYVGEGSGGCTGNERFHDALDADWQTVERISIPQWPGMHDEVRIYQRRTIP